MSANDKTIAIQAPALKDAPQSPVTTQEQQQQLMVGATITISADMQKIKESMFVNRILQIVQLLGLFVLGAVLWGNQNQLYSTTQKVGEQAARQSQKVASAAATAAANKVEENLQSVVETAVESADAKAATARHEDSKAALESIEAQAKKAATKAKPQPKR